MTQACPRCAASFECLHGNLEKKCWCAAVELDGPQREFIAACYDGCLCPACLTLVKDAFYALAVNPKYARSPQRWAPNAEKTSAETASKHPTEPP
jgi:hypothetical protein